MRRLECAFPEAEIDPTDHHRIRLLRELEFWSSSPDPRLGVRSGTDGEGESELRKELTRQSWDQYQRCGPYYRFVVLFPSGHRVSGGVARLSIYFRVPPGLPTEHRERLLVFLRSLRMGEPKMDTEGEEAEPGAATG